MKLNSFAAPHEALFLLPQIVKIVICYLFHAILLVEGVDATHAGVLLQVNLGDQLDV